MDINHEPCCQQCEDHTDNEFHESVGLLVTGLRAYLDIDLEMLKLVQSQVTDWDVHVLLTLFAEQIWFLYGEDWPSYLAAMRDHALEALHEAPE